MIQKNSIEKLEKLYQDHRSQSITLMLKEMERYASEVIDDLIIGRNCFMGYFKNEEETIKTIDKKGFVHSGDVGVIEKNGCLAITGRIK